MTSVEILRAGSIKVGDTGPSFRAKCYSESGDPYNLTGYDATLKLRRSDADTNKVDASVSIDEPDVGVIEYDWQTGDTDTEGTYNGEIVATSGQTTVTFPNEGFFNVRVVEGLE